MVHKKIGVTVEYQDLSAIRRTRQEQAVHRYLSSEMERPFDVTAAPLWRMAAFNFGQDEIVFVFQCHHAIIDGWSDALLMTELNNLYLQLGEDAAYRPKPLQSDYKDFIIEHELSKRDEAIRSYWQQELSDYTRLDLFTPQEEITLHRYNLEEGRLKRLEKTARQLNTTMKAVSLSAYLYMLKVLSSTDEVLTGLVTNMRPNCGDSDKLLGCFLNTIPFKISAGQGTTGAQMVSQVHDKLIAIKDKERLSMLEISLLHNKPSDRANPFFDVLFDYVDFHAYGAVQEEEQSEGLYNGLSALEIGGIDLTNTYLDFIINRTGGAYELSIRLTRRLKSGFSADRLAELYFNILDHIMGQPAAMLSGADHLSPVERDRLLSFNTVAANYSGYTPVLSLFEQQVEANPDAVALRYANITMTYRQLDEKSNRLAYCLTEQYKVRRGELVGIMADRSEKMIIALLGILKAGGPMCPSTRPIPGHAGNISSPIQALRC